jgi:hypothetical protein
MSIYFHPKYLRQGSPSRASLLSSNSAGILHWTSTLSCSPYNHHNCELPAYVAQPCDLNTPTKRGKRMPRIAYYHPYLI